MRPILTALALVLPVAATAQTTVGALSGTLDGRQIAWSIMDGEDFATGWRETENGVEVTLEAVPSDTPMDAQNRLTITFTADAATRYPDEMSARVELLDDGTTLTGTDDAVSLELGNVEATSDSLLTDGNIRVTMAEGPGNVDLLAEEGRTLSADFQATVIRRDDAAGSDEDAAG